MRSTSRAGKGVIAAVLPLVWMVGGCADEGATGPTDEDEIATLTVDASEGWAYVELTDPAMTVEVADPTGASGWDVAFFATSVMLNGGAAGPAGVVGHCICDNEAATDAELMQMTPDSERDAFEAVTAQDAPAAEEAWTADSLAAAISGWYGYDPATHTVSAVPERVWKVRTAEGTGYAKLHVIGIEGAARDHAGKVTIEFAVQAEAGGAMGAPDTAVVDVSDGAVHFDLAMGAVSDASEWDVAFEGYAIRVNGGVSGDGEAGAVRADASFDEIDDASDLPAGHYRGDGYGGAFAAHPWYRYDLQGEHQIWPTYDVYLVKRGSEVWKLQLTGYYDETGDARHITFRYAKLSG